MHRHLHQLSEPPLTLITSNFAVAAGSPLRRRRELSQCLAKTTGYPSPYCKAFKTRRPTSAQEPLPFHTSL